MSRAVVAFSILASSVLATTETACNECARFPACRSSYFLTADTDCDADESNRFVNFTTTYEADVPVAEAASFGSELTSPEYVYLFQTYGPQCNQLETPVLNSAKDGYFCSCSGNCKNEYTDDTLNTLIITFLVVSVLHMVLQVYLRLRKETRGARGGSASTSSKEADAAAEDIKGAHFPGTQPVGARLNWRRMPINSNGRV